MKNVCTINNRQQFKLSRAFACSMPSVTHKEQMLHTNEELEPFKTSRVDMNGETERLPLTSELTLQNEP